MFIFILEVMYIFSLRLYFGGSKYRDKYYDLAKLKHNIFFNHNNIENKFW